MRTAGIAIALFFGMTCPVVAADTLGSGPLSGFTYFTRSGATIEDHDKDLADCSQIVLGVKEKSNTSVYLGSGIAADVFDYYNNRAFARTNVERCMLLRGWEVVRLPEADGAILFAQDASSIHEKLTEWVGHSPPAGTVVRYFGHDGERNVIAINDGAKSLSLKTLRSSPTAAATNTIYSPIFPSMVAAKKPIGPVPVAEITDGPPPGKAIIVVRFTGNTHDGWNAFSFAQLKPLMPDGQRDDGQPRQWFSLIAAKAFGAAQQNGGITVFYVVDPGTWGITGAPHTPTACLMAPTTKVRAGEVVFAGAFDFDRPLNVDVSEQAARATLAIAPTLAERTEPATWVNGSSFPCEGLFVGGYAIDGAPFAPDYPWRPLAEYDAKQTAAAVTSPSH